ncbi:MAG: DMT family transporter, partial [Syntrophales bacterium]|nr:DMT family transporter [Syntrophales bacterium]
MWATVALSIIWGYNWIVMKECLRYCPPFEFAALRTMIGAISLFIFLAFRGQSLKPKALFMTLVLGLLGTTVCIGLVTWGLYLGGVGKTAILVYVMPFWTLILARPILGERIHGLQWLAVPLAFSGLVVILEPWAFRGTAAAGILAVLAGLAWALSAIVTKIIRRYTDYDLFSLTAWQMLLGALPLALICPLIPSGGITWSPYFIVGLLYSSVISQAVALVLWFYILQELPAGTASLGTLATPVIG